MFLFLWWGSTCLHRMRKSPIDLLKQGVSGSDGTYSPWKLELHIATTSDLRIWWSRCLLKDLDWCKKTTSIPVCLKGSLFFQFQENTCFEAQPHFWELFERSTADVYVFFLRDANDCSCPTRESGNIDNSLIRKFPFSGLIPLSSHSKDLAVRPL